MWILGRYLLDLLSIAWRWGFGRDSTKKGLLDENMAIGEDRTDGASKQQR